MTTRLVSRITHLLSAWSAGEPQAQEALMPRVYPQLRRLAQSFMGRERPDHTLQATGLVHEAYLRLADQRRSRWQNRGQFFAVAATVMRRVLLHHAERRGAGKRGGGMAREELAAAFEQSIELVTLDDTLDALGQLDRRQKQIVELRFYGGYTVDEVAQLLGISPATVKREWRLARAWLQRELRVPAAGAPVS